MGRAQCRDLQRYIYRLLPLIFACTDNQAAYWHKSTNPEDSFDIPTEAFENSLAVNTTSAFVAAREALASFQKIDGPKTYIFTGNMLNEGPYPSMLTLGVGKAASAHFVRLADELYKGQNIRCVPASSFVRVVQR